MLKEIYDTVKSELLAEFKTGEGTDVPDQVILVSPADGFITGDITNADFEWQAATGADLYKIQIATDPLFASVVYEQDNISYLKHTVPEGILSEDVQYYWRVRAKNEWGYGELSEVRSFMCAVSEEVSPLTPTEVGTCFFWVRSDEVIADANGISQMTDKSGENIHLTQTNNTYKFSVSSYLGKPTVYNGTENYKQVYYNDLTQKFSLQNKIKSFLLTIVPEKNTPTTAAMCPIARTNPSFGSEWSCQKANSSASLLYCDGQTGVGVVIPMLFNNLMQIVVTCDGANKLTVWVNGAKICEETATFHNVVPDGHAGTFYNLGSYYKTATSQGRFKGHIFENAWFNKVLSDGEIASLYLYHKNYFGL